MQTKNINKDLLEGTERISFTKGPEALFGRIYSDYEYKFLFESKEVADIYGRLSLIGVEPVIKVSGKANQFEIKVLQERGLHFFNQIGSQDLKLCDHYKFHQDHIVGGITRDDNYEMEESQRTHKKNIGQIIRILLEKFSVTERSLLGLYGGFTYDFIRLFEDLSESSEPNQFDDFELYLFDTFVFFDHLKNRTEIIAYRQTTQELKAAAHQLKTKIESGQLDLPECQITEAKFDLSKDDFEQMVTKAKQCAEQGDIFQVVLSNRLKANFGGDPFALYLKYRLKNPSPYLFYFDFGEHQLVGASPEMMVRVEDRVANLRPIAGTASRGIDPVADYEKMIALLNDPKERAELDMLIDLGRNDLSRVCEPGVEIRDYRFIEKYSRVMHTVAHVSGRLKPGMTAFDALIASLNAGTLTGAPKVKAMEIIENLEQRRRGYYGGTVGYLTFSGEMDTAIVIRTAHIRDNILTFQVGAGILYYSKPHLEYQETLNKAAAFTEIFNTKSNV